jgi:hypothetical protein
MPHRVVSISIAGVCAALGFGAAHFVPRPEPPPKILSYVVRDVPAPPPSCVCRAPAQPPTSVPTTPERKPHPTFVSEQPTPVAPPPTTRAPALAAFRFSGLGPSGGLRLGRVRAGTLPDALGLRSGDELLSINGFKISDPEQALIAYARLRTAEKLKLDIRREGAPNELLYVIR